MSKIAFVVLADTEGNESLGRVYNALTAAKEFREDGSEIRIVFSGTGTKWIGELAKSDHAFNALYAELTDRIDGACGYCAGVFGATESVQSAGVCLLEEYGANMSYRRLVNDGYQVLTF